MQHLDIDNSAWQNMTKEQLVLRKAEWQSIRKTLKEIEIIFQGNSYVNSHKHLFMHGELDKSALKNWQTRDGERFANALGMFLAWYHPSKDPEVLWRYLVKHISPTRDFSSYHRKLTLASPSFVRRLDVNYGFFGPKTELLVQLTCRGINPCSTLIDDKEFRVGIGSASVLGLFVYNADILKGVPNEDVPALNYRPGYYMDYLLSEAYEKFVLSENPSTNYVPRLNELFVSALSFYKERNALTDDANRRYVRYRVLNKWFDRTYSPKLLEFIDQTADSIGYSSSWEDVKNEYDDEFVTAAYELPPVQLI